MLRPLRVLLIDNDPLQAARLGEVLMGLENLELVSSGTLAEARENLTNSNEGRIDVVLLDLSAGGLDDLRSLRKSIPGMAIVVLTGDSALAARALEEGAQDHLEKSNTAPEILARSLRYASDRHAGLIELNQARERFEAAFAFAPIGMALTTAAGDFLYVNGSLHEMLGYAPEAMAGMNLVALTHPDDAKSAQQFFKQLAAGELRQFQGETRYLRADGETMLAALTVSTIKDSAGEPFQFVAQIEDVTARRTAQDQLTHQVLHDTLTGLPNRILLFDRLRQSLERAKRLPGSVVVIFVDLDGFKMVNDSMGHDAGDELLREISSRLVSAVRPSDTVARLGGDEFVVVCETLPDESEATSIARRIEESVSAPCFLESGEARVTASLGIVFASPHHTEPDTLIREADTAMFLAKSRGKDRHEVFDEALRRSAEAKLRTQDKLSRAIEDDMLFLEYQPIVSMETGALRGVEALLRYRDSISGVMFPSAFVDIAEESGLILTLGTWALEEACRQAAAWRSEFQSKINVTVNLSPRQAVRPRLLETVMNALGTSGLEPSGLCLELTESVLMEATDTTVRTLEALRNGGISLGIDDFGTGYTSVTYLRRFPVDFLKIDQSFVVGLPNRRDDAAIVRAIIGLSKGMGLTTIAEGVETEEQRQFLREAGCEEAQGYYFGRPGHPDKIAEMLANGSKPQHGLRSHP